MPRCILLTRATGRLGKQALFVLGSWDLLARCVLTVTFSVTLSLCHIMYVHVLPSLPSPQGGMVFVCGTIDGLIQISGRRHNTEDLIATVLAVEPHTLVYKGR